MNITVFAHVLNDEVLIRPWLKHHKNLFSHGVILNVGCTDRSMDLVREICPAWDIVSNFPDKKGYDLSFPNAYEPKFDGWKMCLNIPEFLMTSDLEGFLKEYEKNNPNSTGVRTSSYIIADRPDDHSTDDIDDLFFLRKTFGYKENGLAWNGMGNGLTPESFSGVVPTVYRNRLLHKESYGKYGAGRHTSPVAGPVVESLPLAWFGRGMPEMHFKKGRAILAARDAGRVIWDEFSSRFWDEKTCYNFWESERRKSCELTDEYIEYATNINLLKEKYCE